MSKNSTNAAPRGHKNIGVEYSVVATILKTLNNGLISENGSCIAGLQQNGLTQHG